MGGAQRAGNGGEGSWKGVTQEVLVSLGRGLPGLAYSRPKMMLETVPEGSREEALLGRALQASEMPWLSAEIRRHRRRWGVGSQGSQTETWEGS